MERTASGSDITLNIPYQFNDETLVLTDFKYTVFDVSGAVLVGPVSDPNFNAANVASDITISGEYNITTEKLDIRNVECQLITASGTYKVNVFYEIVGDVLKLTPLTDSFMTFTESVLVRRKISEPMDFYDGLDDETKAIVLSNSYERLIDLQYSLGSSYPCGTNLSDLTLEQFNALDSKFLEAIKKAQIAEANHIVETNPIKDKIRMGIISETIGESSMFFKQNYIEDKSYYPGISDLAYPYLAKWLYKETGNSQIWKLRRS